MILELKTFELYNRKFAEYIRVKGPYKWQAHLKDEACFIYWLNGENKLYTEHGPVVSRGQEAVLLRCGAYIDEIFCKETTEVEAVIVHFYPDLIKRIFREEIPRTFSEKTPTTPLLPVKLKQNILLDKYIDGLLFFFENPELADEELLALKMKELFLLLSKTRQHSTLQGIFQGLFAPAELSFKKVIASNLYSGLSLKELAYLTNCSLATFKRDFQKYYQCAPSVYFRRKKLEKAARLLVSTDMRISDIILESGFSNISHFSRVFKQKYQVSPSAYRLSRPVK